MTTDPAASVVDRVFGADADVASAAQQQIIDTVDVDRMADCATRAVLVQDATRANFWFLEWITAPGVPEDVIANGINAYCDQLLLPTKRFAEAELYLSWLAHSADAARAGAASTRMQELHRARGAAGVTRYHDNYEWRSFDVSLPLDPAWPGQTQYQRTIAWMEARSHDGSLEKVADRTDPEHLSYVAGIVIGMTDALERSGGDLEAAVQGIVDWIDFATRERQGAAARAAAASAPRKTPTPAGPTAPPPAPRENALGNHVDRLFDDHKLAAQIKGALGCSSGFNDDFVVAAIPVSDKLGDSTDFYDQYLVFTKEKVAVVKKSGMFSTGTTECFTMRQVGLVGIGESDHYEAQGFTGRPTAWVSISLDLVDGRRFTRHYFLGHDEREVNAHVPNIRGNLERMGRVGWPIGDGPAWRSSGGYRRSFGYGVAFWN